MEDKQIAEALELARRFANNDYEYLDEGQETINEIIKITSALLYLTERRPMTEPPPCNGYYLCLATNGYQHILDYQGGWCASEHGGVDKFVGWLPLPPVKDLKDKSIPRRRLVTDRRLYGATRPEPGGNRDMWEAVRELQKTHQRHALSISFDISPGYACLHQVEWFSYMLPDEHTARWTHKSERLQNER